MHSNLEKAIQLPENNLSNDKRHRAKVLSPGNVFESRCYLAIIKRVLTLSVKCIHGFVNRMKTSALSSMSKEESLSHWQ